MDASLSTIALPLALIAFAIKLGVFPFHTWLPRTYTSVPPFAAGLLAGVVTSIGAYGMYRFTTGFRWPPPNHSHTGGCDMAGHNLGNSGSPPSPLS